MALRTPLTAQPHLYIGDSTGRPLDYGRVYFGEPNKDPEFYPIDIYLDPEMTIAAAQPVRTKGGFMDVGGNLAELHAAEVVYSLKVLDRYGRQVFYKPEMYRNNVSDFLVDEITRATAAENLIAGNLTTETQRAIAAEKVIADAVVTEKDRAIAAEDALDNKHAALSSTINSLGGGKKAYTTYALMVADKNNIAANSSIDVTNDTDPLKNGTYSYDGAVFAKSIYDVETIVRAKVLDKPKLILSSDTDIDVLFDAGFYMPHNNSEAIAMSLPTGKQGVLFCTGEYYPGQYSQIYFADGDVFTRNVRTANGVWTDWVGTAHRQSFMPSDNADMFKKSGIYTSQSGTYDPVITNLPSNASEFVLQVFENGGRAKQIYTSYKEVAFRSEGASGFTDWYILPLNITTTIANIKEFKEYQFTSGMNANDLKESAFYSSIDQKIDPVITNLPNNASKFVLQVSKSNRAKQIHASYKGMFFRYQHSTGWSDWEGVGSKAGGFYDLYVIDQRIKDLEVASPTAPKIIYGWGSSTLELASSYMSELASQNGYKYVGHGVSGETLAVSGMHQGSNIVTVKFSDGQITNGVAHPVTISHSFELKRGRAYKNIVLSNGVTGQLHFEDNTFTPTNVNTPIEVDNSYGYRATNPAFINQGKGLYYFDVGKNNMSYDETTAQKIVDDLQKMIDYIPEGSPYIVGGHFINRTMSDTDAGRMVVAVNDLLKKRYGKKFCDYYEFLYNEDLWAKHNLTITADDRDKMALGELPETLGRILPDGSHDLSHLRDEMSEELAIQAFNKFKELGYIK